MQDKQQNGDGKMDEMEEYIRKIVARDLTKMAEDHKMADNHYPVKDCSVSLIQIRLWAEKSGIKFTEKQKEVLT